MRNVQQAGTRGNYELFHSSDDFFPISLRYGSGTTADHLRRAFSEGHYHLVDTFESSRKAVSMQLQVIFEESQNIDHSWKGDPPCRSTSVGDVVRIGHRFWIVAGVGFDHGWRDL